MTPTRTTTKTYVEIARAWLRIAERHSADNNGIAADAVKHAIRALDFAEAEMVDIAPNPERT